jgi:hypothetical protein
MADIYVSMRAGSIQQAVRPGAERRVVKPVLLIIAGLAGAVPGSIAPGRLERRLTETRTGYCFGMIGSPAIGTVSWAAPDGDHPARRAAQRSMAAVAAGRKADWIGLFTRDALVEDPVGPSMLDREGKGTAGTAGSGGSGTSTSAR